MVKDESFSLSTSQNVYVNVFFLTYAYCDIRYEPLFATWSYKAASHYQLLYKCLCKCYMVEDESISLSTSPNVYVNVTLVIKGSFSLSTSQNVYVRELLIVIFSKCLCKCYIGHITQLLTSNFSKCLSKCFMVKDESFSRSTSPHVYVNVTLVINLRQLLTINFSKCLCKCYMVKKDCFSLFTSPKCLFSLFTSPKCLCKCYMVKDESFSLSTSQSVYVNVWWKTRASHCQLLQMFM
jgi:hypothetical protein